MTGENIYKDFYEAHQGQLISFAKHAERLVDSNYFQVIVEQTMEDPDGRIVSGESTPESIQSAYFSIGEDISAEDAVEEAQYVNIENLKIAKLNFLLHGGTATKLYIAEQHKNGVPMDDLPSTALEYESAKQHRITPTPSLEVVVTRLHGVRNIGEITGYDFRRTDGLLQHRLNMVAIDSKVVLATTDISPYEDQDFIRWSTILGESNVGDLLIILSGRFEDEEQLDDELSNMWQKFVGTSQEDVITSLLDEIRVRALATKESNQINQLYGFSLLLPTNDALEEWESLLAGV